MEKRRGALGKGAAILTISKVISLLITFVSAMLLSRFRTLEEYGIYSQLLVATTLATSLFALGLPSSINYFLARAETAAERRQFLSVYYTMSTALSILIGFALILSIPLIEGYFKNTIIRSFAFFLAVFPWTSIIIDSISHVLVVYEKLRKLVLIKIVHAGVSLLCILFVQWFGWSFREYIVLLLAGQACITLWVYGIVYQLEEALVFTPDKNLICTILKYSIPIGLAAFLGTISAELGKLIIGRFFDAEALAVYSNASRELPLTIVATSLTAVLLPQMARYLKEGEVKGAIDLWGYSIRLSYIIICFFATACIVFAPQIITVLYSGKYLPGVQVFRISSFVLLLRTTYFGLMLNAIGKTKFILYSSVASLLLNCILNSILYQWLGFIGPAVATLLSILAVNGAQLRFTAKAFGVSMGGIFPWLNLLKITFANAVWGSVAYIIIRALGLGTSINHVAFSVAMGAAITIVYFMLMYRPMRNLWMLLNGKNDTAGDAANDCG